MLILITSILCTSWPASRAILCLLQLSPLQSLFGRKCVSGYLPLLSSLVKSSAAWNYHYYLATCQYYCRYCLQFVWCRHGVRNVISGASCLSLFQRNRKKMDTFTHKNTSANHKKEVKKLASHRMNNVPKIVSLCLENKAFIVLFIRVITHENLFCSYDTASNTSRIATPWYKYIYIYIFFFFFWFLSTVQLTFTEIQLIRISRGSAGCKFKKKKWCAVITAWPLCGRPVLKPPLP